MSGRPSEVPPTCSDPRTGRRRRGADAFGSGSDLREGGTASTWTAIKGQPAGVTNGGTIAVNANGTRVLWSPTGAVGAYFTTSSGSKWTRSSGVPAEARVAADRVNPNRFYAFKDGVFYVSTNGGASWVRINDDEHQYGHTGTAITGDPRIYGRVYVATNGRGIVYADPVTP